MVTVPPSTVSSKASLTCGRPRRSASMAGTTPIAPSVDAMPVRIRSGSPIFFTASARISEVATASDPWVALSWTWAPAVGTHLQGLLDGIGGPVRLHGQYGHPPLIGPLPSITLDHVETCLDRVLVKLREQTVNPHAISGVIRFVERAVRLGVRHVLESRRCPVLARPLPLGV